MTIETKQNGTTLEVELLGRLDTNTSPQLELEFKKNIDGVEELIIDMKNLAYISSAGLRVLLSAQKVMNRQGSMKIINANEDVMEVFEVTGFVDILDIE